MHAVFALLFQFALKPNPLSEKIQLATNLQFDRPDRRNQSVYKKFASATNNLLNYFNSRITIPSSILFTDAKEVICANALSLSV